MAAMAVVAFHPSFIILAGSVNNDMLSVLFSLLSVLAAVRWYREPTLPRILCVALAVGLGMMTKLSVAMVAPAIAVLFAVKFFQSRAFKRLIGQFAAFAAVCCPLGLWWGVRNLIRTDTPLTYVPDIGKSNIQYLATTRSGADCSTSARPTSGLRAGKATATTTSITTFR